MNNDKDIFNQTPQSRDLLTFPCQFPIKVFGKAEPQDAFESAMLPLFKKHFPDLTEGAISLRESKNSNFLALTVTVNAKSKQQLDGLYQEVSAHPLVIMAL